MRIVLANDRIPPEGRGGAESVVWCLAQGLQAAGHEVYCIAATNEASFEETRDGIGTFHIHARYPERFHAWLSLWNPQTSGPLSDIFHRLRPNVFNAHNIHFFLSYHTLKLAREAGVAIVFSSHDAMPFAYGKLRHFVRSDPNEMQLPADYRLPMGNNLRQNRFRYNPFRNLVIRRYLGRYAHLRTVPSQALADAYAANAMPLVEVIHNGINPAEWDSVAPATVAELRGRLGLEGKQVILIAGRLTAEKGMRQMLKALDRLRESLPQARLLVLSSRSVESQIGAEFQHLRPLICSGGWLSGDELRAAYHLADVVAMPSIYLDPFPTVNLEAMAAGKPVIATCFGGSREVVADGETGYIVNPFDTELFADRLARILGDAAFGREMGRLGRERVQKIFSLERQVGQMVEIYERSIAMATRETE